MLFFRLKSFSGAIKNIATFVMKKHNDKKWEEEPKKFHQSKRCIIP
jgi:hypothetical protein